MRSYGEDGARVVVGAVDARALGVDAREVVQVVVDPHARLADAPG